jgi:DNA-binding Xre family transcriptional regulator
MTEGSVQLNFKCSSMAPGEKRRDTYSMAKKEQVISRLKNRQAQQRRRLFIKEWRKYRGLSQETLAERTDMSVSNLSQLETNKQGYSWETIQALAEALNCEPGDLFTVDPTKDNAIWSIWERAKPAEREQIVAVAKALVKTGT